MTYAFFDFDETLIRQNSLALLFRAVTQTRCLGCRAIPALFSAICWQKGLRYAIKHCLYHSCLKGCTSAQLYEAGQQVAHQLTLNTEIVQQLHEHHRQGLRIGIITASPEPFVQGVVAQLGWPCERVMGTLLPEIAGRLTGALDTECAYEEKVVRLQQELGAACHTNLIAYAYGNLPADGPMLRLAQKGFVVTGGRLSDFTEQ